MLKNRQNRLIFFEILFFFLCSRAALGPLASRLFETAVVDNKMKFCQDNPQRTTIADLVLGSYFACLVDMVYWVIQSIRYTFLELF